MRRRTARVPEKVVQAQSPLEAMLGRQVELAGLLLPVREFRFHPTRRWRFDFAWPDVKVACEVEGGTWVQGRHSRATGFASDVEKYSEAALNGWMVIRATGHHVQTGQALRWIERGLVQRVQPATTAETAETDGEEATA